ncbi:putative ubiquinol-cytochrome C reductase complex subunit UcrQ [Aspergillus ellipticus CBS 707.79]|uniref:Cytochrome b-c1 complex subunit 8 n=1 Tax=Aspergillus ellipticus CBS 707.79 TaxID=1448320 RepID=A0A319DQE9_9EURO|nr:putative ubiquinol-cytochrome C reductase complex subunit UcrQ [Aspergillus ellipticus CBS 707.79]
MGGHLDPKNGVYLGWWGDLPGCPTPQRITSYSMSPNRQRPLAGAGHAAVFNTFRRFRHQVLYVAPPFIAAYAIMNWATEKNEYVNSKPGRAELGDE